MPSGELIPRRLARLALEPAHASAIGAGELRLRRAWPRDGGRLLLEFVTPDGRIVGGQWAADPDGLQRAHRETLRAAPHSEIFLTTVNGETILVQPAGADRALPALAGVLRATEAVLISHRVERRAVARVDGAEPRYLKFFRSRELLGSAHDLGRAVSSLAGRSFDAPEALAVDPGALFIAWSALGGSSWRDAIIGGGSPEISRAVGRALRQIHDGEVPPGAPVHDASAECRVLARWVRHAADYGLIGARELSAVDQITSQLGRDETPACLIHRDFHERQVLIGPEGRVGILDFDTLSRGEAALDLGNTLAHFDLAVDQGAVDAPIMLAHAGAFLDGYAPSAALVARTAAYRAGTRLRLTCLHAFRPGAGPLRASPDPSLGAHP